VQFLGKSIESVRSTFSTNVLFTRKKSMIRFRSRITEMTNERASFQSDPIQPLAISILS